MGNDRLRPQSLRGRNGCDCSAGRSRQHVRCDRHLRAFRSSDAAAGRWNAAPRVSPNGLRRFEDEAAAGAFGRGALTGCASHSRARRGALRAGRSPAPARNDSVDGSDLARRRAPLVRVCLSAGSYDHFHRGRCESGSRAQHRGTILRKLEGLRQTPELQSGDSAEESS